ncbi:MAG: tetratricopeptide repeat protein, partial [bacterium]
NHQKHYIAYDYGKDILKVKKNAILFLEGWRPDEPIFYLKYLQYIEEFRKDVKFIEIKHVSPFLIESNLKKGPVYIRRDSNVNYSGYLLIPEGVFQRVVKEDKEGIKWFFEGLKNRPKFTIGKIKSLVKQEITFEDMQRLEAYFNYCKTFYDRGLYYHSFAMYENAIFELKEPLVILKELGIEDFEKIYEKIKGRNYASYIKTSLNLYKEIVGLYTLALFEKANIFYSQKAFDKAIEGYEMVLKLDPNNIQAKQMLEECKKSLDKN